MAAPATGTLEPATASVLEQQGSRSDALASTALLDVVQACFHARSSEWVFLRELRVGTGFRNNAAQRLDAFALNCFAHTSMKRVCYEVKISRADFLCEMKQPLKRRIGLRYSNEFYFLAPAGLLNTSEIPIECGLLEVGHFTTEDRQSAFTALGSLIRFDVNHSTWCRVTVPALWRDTPGPTWQFVAGMLRNQQKSFRGAPTKQANQQCLPFAD